MMRVSTRGRYALRAMADLALHSDQGPVLRREIAMRQQISADYAAQLFGRLRAAGLVKAVKGPGGGYMLARDAAAIRVGDVLRAVEGPIAAVECVIPGNEPSCSRMEGCVAYPLWKRVSEAVTDVLDSVTLKDLRDQAGQL